MQVSLYVWPRTKNTTPLHLCSLLPHVMDGKQRLHPAPNLPSLYYPMLPSPLPLAPGMHTPFDPGPLRTLPVFGAGHREALVGSVRLFARAGLGLSVCL